jgi:hypothetical protein
MMKHIVALSAPIIAITTCALSACAVDSTPSAQGSGTAVEDVHPTDGQVGTVLAQVASGTHTYIFGRGTNGDVVVVETAPIGEAPQLQGDPSDTSLADVYTRLSNGAAAPEVLRNVVIERETTHVTAAPPSPSANEKDAPRVRASGGYTPTPGQQWFSNNFCAPTLPYMNWCQTPAPTTSINSSLGTWEYSRNFYTYGFDDPTSTASAEFELYYWNGSSWINYWGTVVNIGYAAYAHNYGNYTYRTAAISSSNGTYQTLACGIGESNPSATVTYEGATMYVNYDFSGYFDLDSAITCTFTQSGYPAWTTQGKGVGSQPNNYSINVSYDGECYSQEWYNSTAWSYTCVGNVTGQSANPGSIVAPYFSPNNCGCGVAGTVQPICY